MLCIVCALKCPICVVFYDLSRRKASVDENYEWDAADFCSQPGEHDGEFLLLFICFCLLLTCSSHFGTNTWGKVDAFVCLESLINTEQC